MEVLRWTCAVIGLTQIAMLCYLFFSIRLSTENFYVSDALRDFLFVRVTLTVTVLFQTVISMAYVSAMGQIWSVVGIVFAVGIVAGWVVLVIWDETTPVHNYGVGVFLSSVVGFFSVYMYHSGMRLWEEQNIKNFYRQMIWGASAFLYLSVVVLISIFTAFRLESKDPTMYQWLSFILGDVLFMIISLNVI